MACPSLCLPASLSVASHNHSTHLQRVDLFQLVRQRGVRVRSRGGRGRHRGHAAGGGGEGGAAEEGRAAHDGGAAHKEEGRERGGARWKKANAFLTVLIVPPWRAAAEL